MFGYSLEEKEMRKKPLPEILLRRRRGPAHPDGGLSKAPLLPREELGVPRETGFEGADNPSNRRAKLREEKKGGEEGWIGRGKLEGFILESPQREGLTEE